VCHELALKGERAENQPSSILAPEHEEGADSRHSSPKERLDIQVAPMGNRRQQTLDTTLAVRQSDNRT